MWFSHYQNYHHCYNWALKGRTIGLIVPGILLMSWPSLLVSLHLLLDTFPVWFQPSKFSVLCLIITTSPTIILNSFALCAILCRSRKAVRLSLFHFSQAASLHHATNLCLLFRLAISSISGYLSNLGLYHLYLGICLILQFVFQVTYY